MRDIAITGFIFGLLLFAFKRPAIAVFLFTWVSLMNPHRLTYGFAYTFPFAAILAGATVLFMFTSREPKKLPLTPVTVTLFVLAAWMTLSSLFALEPMIVWLEWNRVIKTFFMVIITIMVINKPRDLKIFVWIVALSLGFFGLKGGLFTLASGGHFRVYGPEGSYIAENNGMALALVTVLPLMWYLRSQVSSKWLILGLTSAIVLTAVSVVGSYSRGALIGGVAMLFFLWCHSRKKIPTAIILLSVVALIVMVMPAAWFERMDTINEYKTDDSAMGRVNAWKFAINIATTFPLGGGFNVFTPRMFLMYAPVPLDYHVAHSIWFQVLGDHGWVGLAMFIMLMVFAWRTGTRVRKFCAAQSDLKWASDLSRMCQVCIIGYAVSGTFLSLAYFDLYYDIIIILVCLEKIVIPKKSWPYKPAPTPEVK
ncbi:putative O-glycosylation ligase, exosortase A system-associated [Massilia sp. DWR3-1-1]|uniref:putative O-glycosylation ligase, exosortase A system-associated n=1 Tax=Massilia sp. DWR3-1-1 TaxID=2804559 RepID=UPI003CEE420A